jgi:hypothetical protein
MDRKSLINEYKQRKVVGGVFRILNTKTGMYYLGAAADLQGKRNGFDFMVDTGNCSYYELKQDWQEYGSGAFVFEVLEEIGKKEDQSAADFRDDLDTLRDIWKEKLDPAKRY